MRIKTNERELEALAVKGLISEDAWNKSFEQIDRYELSLDEQILLSCFQYASGKHTAGISELLNLRQKNLSEKSRTLLEILICRLSQNDYAYSGKLPASAPRWFKLFCEKRADIAYPFLPQFFFEMAENNGLDLFYSDICPSCGVNSKLPFLHSISASQEDKHNFSLLFANSNSGYWLCPHCLAKREYNKETLKKALWAWYKQWLFSLPQEKSGKLQEGYAELAIKGAITLYYFAPVRFGALDAKNIGIFILNTGLYIFYKNAGLLSDSLDIIGIDPDERLANEYMAKKWQEVMELASAGAQLYNMTRGTQLAMREFDYLEPISYMDPARLLRKSSPPFSFSDMEYKKAYEDLEKMGIPANAKIACLHIRDPQYSLNHHGEGVAEYSRPRDGNLDNMREACDFLAEQGYYILRTGSEMCQKMTFCNDHIIDYSSNFRSEFMDIWLFSHCDLCVSTSSGPDCLCYFFKKPVVYVDFHMPVHFQMVSFQALYLPKVYFHKSGRRIAIKDFDKLNLCRMNPEDFAAHGITWRHNTPAEILQAVKQKLAMLSGTWRPAHINRQKYIARLAEKQVASFIHIDKARKFFMQQWKAEENIANQSFIADCYIEDDIRAELGK